MSQYISIEDCKASGQHLQAVDSDGYCGGCGEQATDPNDSTAAENNRTAPDEARHVPTANNPHAEGFDATYCIEEKQTADRYHADSLLARVVGAQTAYWNRLRELEQLLGFEIDSSQDLRETDLDTILANPGAPV